MVKIIHISDIHLPCLGDRKYNSLESNNVFTEFKQQIDRLIISVKELIEKNGQDQIVVITGDIFDVKDKFRIETLKQFQRLMELQHLLPVVIIRGNHDYQQNKGNDTDLISCALNFIPTTRNIHYLDSTGTFLIGNINFGLVSIQDILDPKSRAGNNEKLNQFPKPDLTDNINEKTINIALGHLSLAYQNQISLDWFNKWDYILLGDDHGMQVKTKTSQKTGPKPKTKKLEEQGQYLVKLETIELQKGKSMYGYPGSFLQLNKGEELVGHGFLYWDFDMNEVSKYHIKNDYGFYNPMQKFKDFLLPKYNKFVFNTNDLNKMKNEKNKDKNTLFNNIDQNNIQDIISINQKFVKQYWKPDLIKIIEPETKLDVSQLIFQKLISDIEQYNSGIEKIIQDKINPILNESINKKNHLQIEKIQWSWILCYGQENIIDFNNCSTNKVNLISGRNGSGKSSIYEILLMGIFGDICSSRQDSFQSGDFVNKNWKGKVGGQNMPYIKVYVQINRKQYQIIRKFRPDKHNKLKKEEEQLLEYMQLPNQTLYDYCPIVSGKLVNQWIVENIGNLNEFLLSNMLTQNNDQDFLEKKPSEQKKIINQVFGIEVVSQINEGLNESINKNKTIISKIDKVEFKIQDPVNMDLIKEGYNDKITEYEKQYNDLMLQLEQMPRGSKILISDDDCVIISDKIYKKNQKYLNEFNQQKLLQYNMIEKELKKYYEPSKKEIKEIKNMGFLIYDIDSLKEQLFELQQQLKVLQNNIDTKHKKMDQSELQSHLDYTQELQLKQIEIQHFKKTILKKPIKPNFQPPKTYIDINSEKIQIDQELKDKLKDIEFILSYDISELCSKKQYLKKEQEYEEYEKYLKNILKGDFENFENGLLKCDSELVETFNKYKQYSNDYNEVCGDEKEIQDQEQEQSQDVLIKEVSQYYNGDISLNGYCSCCYENVLNQVFKPKTGKGLTASKRQQASEQLLDLWDQHYHKTHKQFLQYQKYEQYIQFFKVKEQYEEFYSKWQLKEYILEQINLNDYNQSYETQYNDYINQLQIFNKEKNEEENLKQEYEDLYEKQQQYIISQINETKNKIKNIEQTLNYKNFNYNQSEIKLLEEDIKKYRLCENECKMYDNKIQYEQYLEYKKVLDNINIIQNEKQQFYYKQAQWEQIMNDNQKQEKLKQQLQHYKEQILKRREQLIEIQNEVQEFYLQQYDKIKETYQSSVNNLLGYLTKDNFGIVVDRDYNILFQKFEYDDNGKYINQIQHTIFKASGFQRFACGLCMRTIMGQVQQLNCKQLFIDEGFVACDNINLENAQTFLQEISKYYQVFLVSHLEQLKDNCDYSLNIITDKDQQQYISNITQ